MHLKVGGFFGAKEIKWDNDFGDRLRIGGGRGSLPCLGDYWRTLHHPHRSLGFRRVDGSATVTMRILHFFVFWGYFVSGDGGDLSEEESMTELDWVVRLGSGQIIFSFSLIKIILRCEIVVSVIYVLSSIVV